MYFSEQGNVDDDATFITILLVSFNLQSCCLMQSAVCSLRSAVYILMSYTGWNVCNEIHAAHIQSTWRLAEAEFIIINRNNIKLFHFTISGDRKIVFSILIFHAFVWISLQFGQMDAVTRQHFQDSYLPSRW